MKTLKGLLETRNNKKKEMTELVAAAEKEERELTPEEAERFDNLEQDVKNLNDQIVEIKETYLNDGKKIDDGSDEPTEEERDIKAFASYIRSTVSGITNREDAPLTKGENGAVIPHTIIKKIMEKVEEISPIYQRATKYKQAGIVSVPVENTKNGGISVSYANEFEDLTSSSNKFTSIELTGYLYGALTKISKSLLRNTDFALVQWVVNKMSKKITIFIEGESINGTEGKIEGIAGSYDKENMTVTLASADKVAADELIDIQELVPDVYQKDCIWIMNKATRKAIRKLKDGQGNYLLEKDSTSKWGYKLLNNDVFISDNVKPLGTADTNVIYYGDFSGLAIKESENTEIQILNELYATQHAVGVVAWGEIDAKVEDKQKIAVAKTSA